MSTKLRPTYGLLMVLCLLLAVSLGLTQSASAQTAQSTPDPTLVALQNTVATQQVQIDTVTRDLKFATRDVYWWFGVAFVLASLLGIAGYRSYATLDEQIRKKINATLDKELYQLDPTMFTIHVPEGHDEAQKDELGQIFQRLQLSGLKNVHWYGEFNKANYRGITVFWVASERDELLFANIIKNLHLDPTRAAIILYAANGYRVKPDTIKLYSNLSLANTPTTVASAVLVVGRGLNAELPANPASKV